MHLFVPYQSTHAQFCSSFQPGNTWRDSSLYLKKTLEEKGGHCSRACTADLHPREIRRLWTETKRQQNMDGRFTTARTIEEKSSGIKEREGGALIFILCNVFYNVKTKGQKVNNQLWIQHSLFSTSVCSRILSACKCHFFFLNSLFECWTLE